MLTKVNSRKLRAAAGEFVIVASKYNARYVDAMVRSATATLKAAKAKNVRIVRVPGAYEVPIVAARLARTTRPLAIICLGVILRGQTTHAAHIGDTVSRALMEIQLEYEVPVIHEVLLLEDEQQAKVRCLDKDHNRGTEAAQTALAMARVMAGLLK